MASRGTGSGSSYDLVTKGNKGLDRVTVSVYSKGMKNTQTPPKKIDWKAVEEGLIAERANKARSLICDFCWNGKPAKIVIARHPISDRGTRKQACKDCIENMKADGYMVREVR